MNKKIKKYTLTAIVSLLIIVIIVALYFLFQYNFINTIEKKCRIGIVDCDLSKEYDNVIMNNMKITNTDVKTHGDEIIQFAQTYNPETIIYYYNAVSSDGKIHSENIVSALDWMKSNNIKTVNISLSTSRYSEDLKKWIDDNNNINIYSSYSNLIQSADYPAMYDNVIGSGIKNDIQKKEIDLIYKSNKIKFFSNLFSTYEGNSYLSVYSAINDADEE